MLLADDALSSSQITLHLLMTTDKSKQKNLLNREIKEQQQFNSGKVGFL